MCVYCYYAKYVLYPAILSVLIGLALAGIGVLFSNDTLYKISFYSPVIIFGLFTILYGFRFIILYCYKSRIHPITQETVIELPFQMNIPTSISHDIP